MVKHPLELEKEDLSTLMHVPLQIGIGKSNNTTVDEVLDGEIIKCSLASNPPYLPADIDFQKRNGGTRNLNFFEIKWIKKY